MPVISHFKGALDGGFRLQGVDLLEPGQGRGLFIDFGVVFHGAGAKGVEPVVDAVGAFHQLGVVAGKVVLRHLGQMQRLSAFFALGDGRHGDIALRQDGAASALLALLKYQFHWAATSFTIATRRSMSALVFFSVQHHRIEPS